VAAPLNSTVRRPGNVVATPFSFWVWRIGLPEGALCHFRHAEARCAGVVRTPVVLKARCAGRGTNAHCAEGSLRVK
jgi:hypothetical protein